jgi:ATP-dependent RNA helicase DeaD
MQTKLFSELGLSPESLKAVDKLGFEQASPIQAATIPLLLQGVDVVGQSQTGSGKTAAFGLPAIEKVDVTKRQTQVLVLCPTRELAVQVSEQVHQLAFFKRGLHALPIYGGQSYDRQFMGLRQGAHIVIGTPGRVMDHMRRGTLRLDAVQLVVLDEVDVMLNMGFREDIEFILQASPATRQTVFFSATIPRPIQQLIEKFAKDPQNVRIEQKAMTVPTVEQIYYEVDRRYKVELLTRLIDIHDFKLGIIFCNTKRMVDDLVDHLNAQGYSADRLHGDMSQAMRDRVMNKFRKSDLEFLVATDVAARGIDVDDVQVVFNFDLPYDGEDYVHRIGRTGRQGRSGVAISFASGRELFQIRVIERYTNTRVQRGRPPTLEEVEDAREQVFLDKVREAIKAGEHKEQEHLVERLLEEGFTSTEIASTLMSLLQGVGSTASRPARTEPEEQRPRAGEQPREYRQKSREPRERPERVRRPQPSAGEMPPQAPAVPKTEKPVLAPAPSAPLGTSPAETIVKPKPQKPRPGPSEQRPPRKTPPTPKGQTRLYINAGSEMGLQSADVLSAILGHTGLPRTSVGLIDLRERHAFVDVASDHANAIISKLNRGQIKDRKVKVKVA